MTTPAQATNPFADPAQKTLQDALDHLDQGCQRGGRERREMASAINSLAGWLHRTPSEIPAKLGFLRQALTRVHPATLGLSKGRVQNVRSLVKRALAEIGVGAGGTYLAVMTPPWQALWERIDDRYGRELLARFMRFASRQGIMPERVDDAVVEAFQQALAAENLTAKPYTAAQSAVRLWNRMVTAVPEWPQRRLSPLRQAERYTLTWEQLPPAFVADTERYLSLQAGDDLTDPLAPPRPLKPLSLKTRKYQIQQLVSALHHQGVDISAFTGLADLCTCGRPRLALQYFITRQQTRKGQATETATSMIGGLAHALKAIAKHYAGASPDDLKGIARLSSRLERKRAGMTEKNHMRLRQLDDPQRRSRLLRFPGEEMAKLALKAEPTRRDAVRYSILLAIELLILTVMRIENVASLDLDRNIILRSGRKEGGAIAITLPRSDVKNEQPLDYLIRPQNASAFVVYLDRFRPLLMSGPSRALFPSHRREAKRADTLATQVSRLLWNELGLRWNPHLFRHLAARICLEANPGDYESPRRLLGHRDAETTYRTYEGAEMRPAVERYDRLIENIRGPAPLIGRRVKGPARRRARA